LERLNDQCFGYVKESSNYLMTEMNVVAFELWANVALHHSRNPNVLPNDAGER
jgi:hypothetical protein